MTVPPADIGYQRGTIPTDVAKESVGGPREKARATAIPHMQAEASPTRDGPKAKVCVAKACVEKANTGGLREKARANAIPHMQREASAARNGPKAKAWVANACLAMPKQ